MKPSSRKPSAPQARRQRSNQYQNLLFDGERFFKEKDYSTAFKILSEAYKIAPTGDKRSLKLLCRCYRKKALPLYKKEKTDALIDVMEAFFNLKGVEEYWKLKDIQVLSEAYLKQGQHQEAALLLERVENADPELFHELKRIKQKLKAEQLHQELKDLF